jgi:hypothetical protein
LNIAVTELGVFCFQDVLGVHLRFLR